MTNCKCWRDTIYILGSTHLLPFTLFTVSPENLENLHIYFHKIVYYNVFQFNEGNHNIFWIKHVPQKNILCHAITLMSLEVFFLNLDTHKFDIGYENDSATPIALALVTPINF